MLVPAVGGNRCEGGVVVSLLSPVSRLNNSCVGVKERHEARPVWRLHTLIMLETKLTTSGNFRMSTSKCLSSFLTALVVMTLDLSLTAARFLR